MKHLFLFLTALCISVPVVSAEPLNKAKQGVEVVTDKHGATIRINGQLFTRYLIDAGPKPYCWPSRIDRGKVRTHPLGPI